MDGRRYTGIESSSQSPRSGIALVFHDEAICWETMKSPIVFSEARLSQWRAFRPAWRWTRRECRAVLLESVARSEAGVSELK